MSTGPDPAEAIQVFKAFVAAINAHDVERLASLMTADHLFVDSVGNHVEGAERMRAGWQGYFALCPDYTIRIANLMAEADTVLATGEARGTIDAAAWRTPAAWQAETRKAQVAEWRVFADNKPVYDLIARRNR